MEPKRISGLDGIRAAAAIYVAVAHVLKARLDLGTGAVDFFLSFGQEAVMIFFLLSGAVIRISVQSRDGVVDGSFLARRIIRLWPILLLGLALGYLSQAGSARSWVVVDWVTLAGNLCFLQDFASVKPGVVCDTYYSNSPLWSLSYEWWFYVMFFVLWKTVRAPWRTHAAGAVSLMAGGILWVWPHALGYWAGYFIIWWSGGVLVGGDNDDKRRAAIWLAASAGLAVAHAWWAGFQGASLRPGVFPVLMARHLVFALLAMAAYWFLSVRGKGVLSAGARVLGSVAWAAPYSYGLYVLHSPIAGAGAWLPWALPGGFSELAVYTAATVLIVWWAERVFHPWASKWPTRAVREKASASLCRRA